MRFELEKERLIYLTSTRPMYVCDMLFRKDSSKIDVLSQCPIKKSKIICNFISHVYFESWSQ